MSDMSTISTERLNAAGETKINVSVEFTLLSAVLAGAVEKNEKGIEFLVMPQQNNSTDKLPLDSVVDGINNFFNKMTGSDEFDLDIHVIIEKLKAIIKDVMLEAMKFKIKQAFVHLIKPADGKIQFEYAFSIGMDLEKDMIESDSDYNGLRSVTFGIWNTDNKKVLSKMDLLNISEQLAVIGE